LSLDEVLDVLYEELPGVIPYNRIDLVLANGENKTLVVRWSRSDRPRDLVGGCREPLQRSVLRHLLRSRSPKIIHDLEAYVAGRPDTDSTSLIARKGMRSVIACPLVSHDEPVGLLLLSSTMGSAYSEVDMVRLQQIGTLVSTVLERDRLRAELAVSQSSVASQKDELRMTREESDRFFNLSLDLLCVAGTDGYFKSVNPSFERVLGFSFKELLSIPFLDLVHPDDRQTTLKQIERLSRGVPTIAFENRYRCKDGSYRWLEWNARPLAEEGRLYAVARDVTAYKALDQKLRAVVESAPVAMILIDPEGRIELANRLATAIFGYSAEELSGRPAEILMPDRVKNLYGQRREELLSKSDRTQIGMSGNLYGLRKDGREVPVEIVTNVIELGGSYLLAAVTDITERKKSMARIRTIVESSPDGILLVDLDGRIALMNSAAERIFGYKRRELLDKPLEILLPEKLRERHRDHRRAFNRQGRERAMGTTPYDLHGLRKDGSEVPLDIALKPIEMEDGKFVITTVRDLTERRKLEREFRVAHQIQRALVPDRMPSIPGFDIAADWRPAEATCGDFLYHTTLVNGGVVLAVGDVSGHGVGPAILTACVRSYLRAFVQIESELPAILTEINRLLFEETRLNDFVTTLIVRVDPHRHSLRFANAGHPGGFVFDDNGELSRRLGGTGRPLGMFPDSSYGWGVPVDLNPGDTVLLISDGITEATAPDGRFFGDEGVVETVRSTLGESAGTTVTRLHEAALGFSEAASRADDMTVMVIKVDPAAPAPPR
jgi:PAS domain S-box-containing protein